MKVTIIKKTVKEGISERTGSQYRIASLFVKFSDSDQYNKIVKYLKEAKGATIDQIEKFCKPKEYNGKTDYAFGLNCSSFTFDRVEQFGELDANIIFDINDSGFINAKIKVENRKEQVNGYTPPESEVEGWAVEAPDPIGENHGHSGMEEKPAPPHNPYPYDGSTVSMPDPIGDGDEKFVDDLPF